MSFSGILHAALYLARLTAVTAQQTNASAMPGPSKRPLCSQVVLFAR